MNRFHLLTTIAITIFIFNQESLGQSFQSPRSSLRDSLASRKESIQRFDGAKVFFEQRRSTKEGQAQSVSRSRSDYIPRDNRILDKIIYTYYSPSQSNDTTNVVYDYQYRPDSSYFFSDSSSTVIMTSEILDTPDSTFDKYSVYYINERDTTSSIRFDEFSSYDCDGEYCNNIVQTISHFDDRNYNRWMFTWQDTVYFNPYAYSGISFDIDLIDSSYFYKYKYWHSEVARPVYEQTYRWYDTDAEWELSSEYEMLEESPAHRQYERRSTTSKRRYTETFNDSGLISTYLREFEDSNGQWVKSDTATYTYNEQGLLESYVDFYKRINLANNTEAWLPYVIDSTFYDTQGKVSKYIRYSTGSRTLQRLYTRSATDSTYALQRFNRSEQQWVTYDSIHYEWSNTPAGRTQWREKIFYRDYSSEQLYLWRENLHTTDRTGALSELERSYYRVSGQLYNYYHYKYVTKELPILELSAVEPTDATIFIPTTVGINLTHAQDLHDLSVNISWNPDSLEFSSASLAVEDENLQLVTELLTEGTLKLSIRHKNPTSTILTSSNKQALAHLEMIPLKQGLVSMQWVNDAKVYAITDTKQESVYPRIFEPATIRVGGNVISGSLFIPEVSAAGEVTEARLSGAPVHLTSDAHQKLIHTTNDKGEFIFDKIDARRDYLLGPGQFKNAEPDYSIQDILSIYSQNLTSWQNLAGDINHDLQVNELDAFLLTSHLLGKETVSSLKEPFRSVHLPSYEAETPYQFENQVTLKNPIAAYHQDFLVFYKGDVDFSSFAEKVEKPLVDTLYIQPTVYERPAQSFLVKLEMDLSGFQGMQAAAKIPSMLEGTFQTADNIYWHYQEDSEELRWVIYGDQNPGLSMSFHIANTAGLDFEEIANLEFQSLAITHEGEEAYVAWLPAIFYANLPDESTLLPFPNPVGDQCFTDVNLVKDEVVFFELTDLNGKTIFQQNQVGAKGFQRLAWDLSGVQSGVYTFRISLGDYIQSGSIVKK